MHEVYEVHEVHKSTQLWTRRWGTPRLAPKQRWPCCA